MLKQTNLSFSALKETIDNYMESTKTRKGSNSSASLSGDDDVQDSFDDEDPQSISDFAEFQRWLDAGSPARRPLAKPSSSAPTSAAMPSSSSLTGGSTMPPPMAPVVPGCKCFKNPCFFDCNRQYCLISLKVLVHFLSSDG